MTNKPEELADTPLTDDEIIAQKIHLEVTYMSWGEAKDNIIKFIQEIKQERQEKDIKAIKTYLSDRPCLADDLVNVIREG